MKKKIEEINVMRAIACVMVILIHITADPVTLLPAGSIGLMFFSAVNRLAKPSVPVFIFISGLTLFYKYREDPFEFIPFMKKRFSAILVPYLSWSVLYYLIYVRKGYYPISLSFLVKGILLGDIIYHLYFVVIILQFYLLFGVFHYLFKKFNPGLVLAGMAAIQILTALFIRFRYGDRFFATYLIYFAMGCYAAVNLDKFKAMLERFRLEVTGLFLLLAAYYCWQFYSYNTLKWAVSGKLVSLTFLGYCIIALIFLYYMSMKAIHAGNFFMQLFNRISDASFYIYLAHPLAMIVAVHLCNRLDISSTVYRFFINGAVILVTVFPASMLYVRYKSKLPNLLPKAKPTSKSA